MLFLQGPGPHGKAGFIGCRSWELDDPDRTKHRYVPLPADVDDELVRELSRNGGRLRTTNSDLNTVSKCAHIVSPRNGGKGSKECRKSPLVYPVGLNEH